MQTRGPSALFIPLAVAVAVAGAAFGCGAGDASSDDTAGTFAFEAFTVEIGTLPDNGSPFGPERAAALPGELARSEADVLCLNGIDDPKLRDAVALVPAFPFRVDMPTDESTPITDPADAAGVVPPAPSRPACVAADEALLSEALSCFAAKCSNDGKLTTSSCIYNGGCAGSHNALEQSSLDCHACFHNCAEYSGYTFAETKEKCTGSSRGVPLARRGRHGTMLLSKHPLSNVERFVLPATERQVVLAATVGLPNGAAVDAYCLQTSWTPDRPNATDRYRGHYGGGDPMNGWFREHELQVRRLVSFVHTRSQSRRAVVLGDMQASPQVEDEGTIVIEAQNATGLLPLESAFVEAVPAGFRPVCTTCGRTNRLLEYSRQRWTTHIFLSGMSAANVRTSHRTFMGDVVRTADERRPSVPLSSSYGFRTRLVIDP